MTFIEPFLFWLFVPFIVLPIIIHFVNRMRYQPLQWAAMEFLFKAKRSSTKFARLKDILILACRCLALLFLAMTLARPLSGGWLGWAMSGNSDSVIILLDRSSSMAALDESGQVNKLQEAIKMIRQTAEQLSSDTKFTVIDSGTRKAVAIDDLAKLEDELLYGVSDVGSNMRDLLDITYEHIIATNPGNCEIWLTTDLQLSNWQPESDSWKTLNADFKRLKSRLSFRVLALTHEPEKNVSVVVRDVNRRQQGKNETLEVIVELNKNYTSQDPIQLTVNLNGVETARQIKMGQDSLVFTHKFKLSDEDTGGTGYFKLPDDRQPGDNIYYFAYGKSVNGGTAVVSENKHAKFLALAASPPKNQLTYANILDASALQTKSVEDYSLVIVDSGQLPEAHEKKLLNYVDRGGQLLVFPPLRLGKRLLKFIEPDEIEEADKQQVYGISSWDEMQGPLADTIQGEALPLNKLLVTTRQLNKDPGQVLASYNDGQPFLSRYGFGKGAVYYCSSSISRKWSDLYKGPVLLPMLNRLVHEGSKKFSSISFEDCRQDDLLGGLVSLVGENRGASQSLYAGIYKTEKQDVYVFNRPETESDSEKITGETLERLFSGLDFTMFDKSNDEQESETQSELFSLFAVIMLLFLVAEGFLTLRKPLAKEVA